MAMTWPPGKIAAAQHHVDVAILAVRNRYFMSRRAI
jgi:hypothetical protein